MFIPFDVVGSRIVLECVDGSLMCEEFRDLGYQLFF